MTKKKLDDAYYEASSQIEDAIATNGPYTHNLISAILRIVDGKYGKAAANGLVREHNLKSLFGINPQ